MLVSGTDPKTAMTVALLVDAAARNDANLLKLRLADLISDGVNPYNVLLWIIDYAGRITAATPGAAEELALWVREIELAMPADTPDDDTA